MGGGLVTPVRSKVALSNKFSAAYGYTDKEVTHIIIANLTGNEIVLSKDRLVGELHPRDADVYDVVPCEGGGKGGRDYFYGINGRAFEEGFSSSQGATNVKARSIRGINSNSQSNGNSINNSHTDMTTQPTTNPINIQSCNNNINNTEDVVCIAAGMVPGKDSLPIGGLQATDETASATTGKGAQRSPNARSEWNLTREQSNGAPPSGSGNRKIASDQGREPSGVHNETESVAGAISGTECVIDWSSSRKNL